MRVIKNTVLLLIRLVEIASLPLLLLICTLARFKKKAIDVGLGPEPMINNVYHKKALLKQGYTAETFTSDVYFITDEFDIILSRQVKQYLGSWPLLVKLVLRFGSLMLFSLSVWRYRCVYIYFNGGPLGTFGSFFWRLEPFLYHLAKVKVLVMPYGGDVQDMLRTPNLSFRHAMAEEYPMQRLSRQLIVRKIDLWTNQADHIISGCDWVDYMHYWDSLMLAHFSIDTERWQAVPIREEGPLRLLHAPNHRILKGTEHFIRAVDELQAEGVPLELTLLEGVPNTQIREAIANADVVADQLVIGWYAMFALEGMSMGRPVLCYLREDLEALYCHAGLVKEGEIPIVNCDFKTVKEKIRRLAEDRSQLQELGRRSREFVERHHSLDVIGKKFVRMHAKMGLERAC